MVVAAGSGTSRERQHCSVNAILAHRGIPNFWAGAADWHRTVPATLQNQIWLPWNALASTSKCRPGRFFTAFELIDESGQNKNQVAKTVQIDQIDRQITLDTRFR